MGQMADILGIGPLFTRDGKEYQVSPIQPYHRGMFEAWVEKQVWEAIERASKWVSEATQRINISVLQQDIAAQRYAQGTTNYDDASRSKSGVRYLLTIMLRDKHKETTEEWVDAWMTEKPEEAIRIYNQAIGANKPEPSKSEPDS